MAIPWEMVAGMLMIFAARVCDVTIGTVRLIFLTRGQKYPAALLGFVEVFIFIVAISQVLRGELNALLVFGYCSGFAVGTIVGVTIEERIALGYSLIRVFSQEKGSEIAQALRDADFGVTETFGQGRSGSVAILETAVRRRDVPTVQRIVGKLDGHAFVVMDEARTLFQGYLRKGK